MGDLAASRRRRLSSMPIPGVVLDRPTDRPLRVLAIGAHADDVEIGAGGTLLRFVAEVPDLDVHWVVLSATGGRAEEARASAEQLLAGVPSATIRIEAFRERFFPHLPELKDWFDDLAADRAAPDLVIGPRLEDAHQDHRTVAELIRQTFRAQAILEYEIPKLEGDLGRPNLFVELTPAIVRAKLDHLEAMFPSQRSRTWFRRDLFEGLLALRGVEGGTATGYAEAFTARTIRIGAALTLDPRRSPDPA
jgi:LmbE family N-acetylglucosaminyl deacetylase